MGENPTTARDEPLESPLKTFEESARYLGVPVETLRYWLAQGRGPRSYKLGKHRRFKIADLDAFIETRAEG